MVVFQVYPTATRALGLGTCSVHGEGALITRSLLRQGVTRIEVGVTQSQWWGKLLPDAEPLHGPCVRDLISTFSNPLRKQPYCMQGERGVQKSLRTWSKVTQLGGRSWESNSALSDDFNKTVWIEQMRLPYP